MNISWHAEFFGEWTPKTAKAATRLNPSLALILFIPVYPKSFIGSKFPYPQTVDITCMGTTTISVARQGEWSGSSAEQMVCPAKEQRAFRAQIEVHMPQ
jgi:hypothetical protein